jgi:hypothetical protein
MAFEAIVYPGWCALAATQKTLKTLEFPTAQLQTKNMSKLASHQGQPAKKARVEGEEAAQEEGPVLSEWDHSCQEVVRFKLVESLQVLLGPGHASFPLDPLVVSCLRDSPKRQLCFLLATQTGSMSSQPARILVSPQLVQPAGARD